MSSSLMSDPERTALPAPTTRARSRNGGEGDASKVLEELERVRNGIQARMCMITPCNRVFTNHL
jgi:hypothetical protein